MCVHLGENAPYLVIAFGIAMTIVILTVMLWVSLYLIFPKKIPSPFPNLLLGEDPYRPRE